jgi:hypothetical protein
VVKEILAMGNLGALPKLPQLAAAAELNDLAAIAF